MLPHWGSSIHLSKSRRGFGDTTWGREGESGEGGRATRLTPLHWGNAFGKPWAEVVREGSPYSPEGKMEVKATVQLLTKE